MGQSCSTTAWSRKLVGVHGGCTSQQASGIYPSCEMKTIISCLPRRLPLLESGAPGKVASSQILQTITHSAEETAQTKGYDPSNLPMDGSSVQFGRVIIDIPTGKGEGRAVVHTKVQDRVHSSRHPVWRTVATLPSALKARQDQQLYLCPAADISLARSECVSVCRPLFCCASQLQAPCER